MNAVNNRVLLIITLFYILQEQAQADLIIQLSNMHIENMNQTLCALEAGVKYFNRTTKVPRMSALFKKDVSHAKVHMVVYQWRNNQFKKFTPVEVNGYLNSLVQTQLFDIEHVFRNYWTPPVIPPIKSNITYVQGDDYVFERWPVTLLEGKWKVKMHLYLHDKSDLMGTLVIDVNTVKPL